MRKDREEVGQSRGKAKQRLDSRFGAMVTASYGGRHNLEAFMWAAQFVGATGSSVVAPLVLARCSFVFIALLRRTGRFGDRRLPPTTRDPRSLAEPTPGGRRRYVGDLDFGGAQRETKLVCHKSWAPSPIASVRLLS